VHDHLGAAPGQLFGRCLADARGRAGDQRAQALEVSLFVHVMSFRLVTPTMDTAGPAPVSAA